MAEKPRRALPSLKLHESGMSMREIRARMQAGEPPATAEEYLLRVRLEADDLGTIIGHQKITVNAVTAITTSSTTSTNNTTTTLLPDFEECPPALLPSRRWQRHCASCFSECRQYVVRVQALSDEKEGDHHHRYYSSQSKSILPPMNDGYAWERLCFGTNSFAVATGKHDPSPVPFEETLPPLLHVVMGLSLDDSSKLLRRHIRWLTGGDRQQKNRKVGAGANPTGSSAAVAGGGGGGGLVRTGRPLTTARAAWLYALLVRVVKPLSRQDAATLRSLGRYLSKVRATKIQSSKDQRLGRINMLLTLIEHGFGQGRV
jgi:hypothetical protein